MQHTHIRGQTGLRITEILIAATVMLVSGCRGDKITPGNQDVSLVVLERATGKHVAGALVTASFPAPHGLDDVVRDELEFGPKANLDTATTDAYGKATIAVMISGPPFSLGPDQITGGPIAFRVEANKAVEYLFDDSAHVGDVLNGASFDVEIEAIGKPYRRQKR